MGKLTSNALIRAPNSFLYILGFEDGVLEGVSTVISSSNSIKVFQFENGKMSKLLRSFKSQDQDFTKRLVSSIFPEQKESHSAIVKFSQSLREDMLAFNTTTYFGSFRFFEEGIFYGLVKGGQPFGLGVYFSKQKKSKIGWMKDGNISGTSRIIDDSGMVMDTFFQNGKMEGETFIYHVKRNDWKLVLLDNNEVKEVDHGSGFPRSQLAEKKRWSSIIKTPDVDRSGDKFETIVVKTESVQEALLMYLSGISLKIFDFFEDNLRCRRVTKNHNPDYAPSESTEIMESVKNHKQQNSPSKHSLKQSSAKKAGKLRLPKSAGKIKKSHLSPSQSEKKQKRDLRNIEIEEFRDDIMCSQDNRGFFDENGQLIPRQVQRSKSSNKNKSKKSKSASKGKYQMAAQSPHKDSGKSKDKGRGQRSSTAKRSKFNRKKSRGLSKEFQSERTSKYTTEKKLKRKESMDSSPSPSKIFHIDQAQFAALEVDREGQSSLESPTQDRAILPMSTEFRQINSEILRAKNLSDTKDFDLALDESFGNTISYIDNDIHTQKFQLDQKVPNPKSSDRVKQETLKNAGDLRFQNRHLADLANPQKIENHQHRQKLKPKKFSRPSTLLLRLSPVKFSNPRHRSNLKDNIENKSPGKWEPVKTEPLSPKISKPKNRHTSAKRKDKCCEKILEKKKYIRPHEFLGSPKGSTINPAFLRRPLADMKTVSPYVNSPIPTYYKKSFYEDYPNTLLGSKENLNFQNLSTSKVNQYAYNFFPTTQSFSENVPIKARPSYDPMAMRSDQQSIWNYTQRLDVETVEVPWQRVFENNASKVEKYYLQQQHFETDLECSVEKLVKGRQKHCLKAPPNKSQDEYATFRNNTAQDPESGYVASDLLNEHSKSLFIQTLDTRHLKSPHSRARDRQVDQIMRYGRITGTKGHFGEDFGQMIPALNDTRQSHSPNHRLANNLTFYPVDLNRNTSPKNTQQIRQQQVSSKINPQKQQIYLQQLEGSIARKKLINQNTKFVPDIKLRRVQPLSVQQKLKSIEGLVGKNGIITQLTEINPHGKSDPNFFEIAPENTQAKLGDRHEYQEANPKVWKIMEKQSEILQKCKRGYKKYLEQDDGKKFSCSNIQSPSRKKSYVYGNNPQSSPSKYSKSWYGSSRAQSPLKIKGSQKSSTSTSKIPRRPILTNSQNKRKERSKSSKRARFTDEADDIEGARSFQSDSHHHDVTHHRLRHTPHSAISSKHSKSNESTRKSVKSTDRYDTRGRRLIKAVYMDTESSQEYNKSTKSSKKPGQSSYPKTKKSDSGKPKKKSNKKVARLTQLQFDDSSSAEDGDINNRCKSNKYQSSLSGSHKQKSKKGTSASSNSNYHFIKTGSSRPLRNLRASSSKYSGSHGFSDNRNLEFRDPLISGHQKHGHQANFDGFETQAEQVQRLLKLREFKSKKDQKLYAQEVRKFQRFVHGEVSRHIDCQKSAIVYEEFCKSQGVYTGPWQEEFSVSPQTFSQLSRSQSPEKFKIKPIKLHEMNNAGNKGAKNHKRTESLATSLMNSPKSKFTPSNQFDGLNHMTDFSSFRQPGVHKPQQQSSSAKKIPSSPQKNPFSEKSLKKIKSEKPTILVPKKPKRINSGNGTTLPSRKSTSKSGISRLPSVPKQIKQSLRLRHIDKISNR